jgi:hypothetical protein
VVVLPNLAVQADVEALLNRPLTTNEAIYAASLLSKASGRVREWAQQQQITQTLGDVIVLHGVYGTRLVLPQRPVTNVSVVVLTNSASGASPSWVFDRFGNLDIVSNATQNTSDTYRITDGGGNISSAVPPNLFGPAGTLFPGQSVSPSWGGPACTVTVTYDHGYSVIPSTVVDEVAGMVAAQLAVPVGVLQEKIGGYDVKYIRPPGGGMVLTDNAKASLAFLRIRTSSSSLAIPR